MLSRAERAAAMAVLGLSAAVGAAGWRLAKRQARYRARQAAAFFGNDIEEDVPKWPDDAVWEKDAADDAAVGNDDCKEENETDMKAADEGSFGVPAYE